MSEEKPLIYQTIIDVMGKIGAVGKDRKNQQQNFKYRGIDDVMNELHGVMAECGLFVVPSVLSESRDEKPTKSGGLLFYTRMTIRFTFYAKDGSHIESVVIGEAMDSGDKASNKALAIGLKYALLQVFCIPTEDEKDPDGQTHEPTTGNQPKNNAQQNNTTQNNGAKQNPPKPQLKGGETSPEDKAKIKDLLERKFDDGTPIFLPKEMAEYLKMRTEKTAAELIEFIEKELNKRNPPKDENAQAAQPAEAPQPPQAETAQAEAEPQQDIF